MLLILAIPVLGLRLGFADESNFPEDTTTKQAYDLLVEGFGEGFNGPMLLVAELPTGVDRRRRSAAVTDAVAADPGVASCRRPIPTTRTTRPRRCGCSCPPTGPQEEATTELVNRLRDDVLPPVEQATGSRST